MSFSILVLPVQDFNEIVTLKSKPDFVHSLYVSTLLLPTRIRENVLVANGPQEQTHLQPAAQQQQQRRIDTPHLSEPERVLIQVQLEAGRQLPELLRHRIFDGHALELEFEGARERDPLVFMLFFCDENGRVTVGRYDANPACALEPGWFTAGNCSVDKIVAFLVAQTRRRGTAP